MTDMRINRLRLRFGITEAQARLYIELHFGGLRDD